MIKTFSIPLAQFLGRFAQHAYGQTPFPVVDGPYCVTQIDCERTDTHADMIELSDRRILAFRGTESREDMFEDAEIELVPCMFGRVHLGFTIAFHSVADQIDRALLIAPNKPLAVTGHSLGGALAKMAALSIAYNRKATISSVITFGEPRWADRQCASEYDALLGGVSWRVVHSLDPVALIPWLCGRYRHTRNEAWLENQRVYENLFWLANVDFRVKTLWGEWRRGEMEPLPDHGMDRYLEALEELKNPASECTPTPGGTTTAK